MPVRRVRVLVSGRVQGVFFRASLRDAARRQGITGWARNRQDGNVEAEAQGDPAAVEQLLAFCRQGPRDAVVDDVTVVDVDVVDGESGFVVR
jgi:acylphosphatase